MLDIITATAATQMRTSCCKKPCFSLVPLFSSLVYPREIPRIRICVTLGNRSSSCFSKIGFVLYPIVFEIFREEIILHGNSLSYFRLVSSLIRINILFSFILINVAESSSSSKERCEMVEIFFLRYCQRSLHPCYYMSNLENWH